MYEKTIKVHGIFYDFSSEFTLWVLVRQNACGMQPDIWHISILWLVSASHTKKTSLSHEFYNSKLIFRKKNSVGNESVLVVNFIALSSECFFFFDCWAFIEKIRNAYVSAFFVSECLFFYCWAFIEKISIC